MNKTIVLFFVFMLGRWYGAQASPVAMINYDHGYYNPFAWSMKWNFKYQEKLDKNQRIKIIFTLTKAGKRVDLPAWEHVLGKMQKECDIYFFLQNNTPAGKYMVRMDVTPCERFSSSWTFNHQLQISHEIIYATYPRSEIAEGKEMLLAKFYEQSQGGVSTCCADMHCNKITVMQIVPAKKKSDEFLSLEIFCRFIIINANESIDDTVIDVKLLSSMADSELLQLKDKLRKNFENGCGALQTLNAVQKEINSRRNLEKQKNERNNMR